MVKVVGQNNKTIVVGGNTKTLIDPVLVINGKDGLDGKEGPQGPAGKDGIDGKNGLDGRDGKDGLNGKDGVDGKNGVTFTPQYDEKSGTLSFTNDGGLKNPKPIKLPGEKAWGFGLRKGGGGGQLPSDWNQKDPNNPTFIKNKPDIDTIKQDLDDLGDQVQGLEGSKQDKLPNGTTGYYLKKTEDDVTWDNIVNDSSTTSTTQCWSASKLNGIIGDIETLIEAL